MIEDEIIIAVAAEYDMDSEEEIKLITSLLAIAEEYESNGQYVQDGEGRFIAELDRVLSEWV
jgi:hypothetical protein